MAKATYSRAAGRAACLALLFGLGACATLPAPEATAFRELAGANKDAFAGLAATEDAALSGLAIRGAAANRGRILSHDCGPASDVPCSLTYNEDGTEIALGLAAPNTRALISAIARYGEQMAELAEAEDIDEVGDKAQAAGGAVQALIGVVFPGAGAIAKPIVDAAALAFRGKLIAKRRHLLLINALAAKRAVDTASDTMTAIAGPTREHILIASAAAMRSAARAMDESSRAEKTLEARAERLRGRHAGEASLDLVQDRIEALRDRRALQADAMIRAGHALNAARGLGTDFGALKRAHDALIVKLQDPSVSLESAMKDLSGFLVLLDGFSAAAKS